MLIGLLVIAVGFLFVHGYVFDGSSEASVTVPQAFRSNDDAVLPKVAVLPCDNLSPDPNDAYFAKGIHEEILNQLGKLSGLLVSPGSSVLQYEEERPAIPQIGRALGAQAVLECSVRFAGDNIVVTTRLSDPATDTQVSSETYPANLSDLSSVFAIQSSIAINIASALEVSLSLEEQQRMSRPLTDSADAVRLYFQAISLGEQGPNGLGTRRELHRLLDKAIELDPGFARAHALKALDFAFAMTRARLANGPAVDEFERLAMEHVLRALALDPEDNVAFVAMANIHRFNWRATEAESAFERALELAPNDFLSLQTFAHFLSYVEDYERATLLARRAVEIDASSMVLGNVYMRAGDYDSAFHAFSDLLDWRADYQPHWGLAVTEVHRGNKEAALSQIQAAERLMPEDDPSALSDIIEVYGLLDRPDDAQRLLRELVQMAEIYHVPASRWVRAYLGIEDHERVLSLLRQIDEQRSPEDSVYSFSTAINEIGDPTLERAEYVDLRRRIALSR